MTESDKLAAELQTAGLNSLVDFLYGDILVTWTRWRETTRKLREYEDDYGIFRYLEKLAHAMEPLHEAGRKPDRDQLQWERDEATA